MLRCAVPTSLQRSFIDPSHPAKGAPMPTALDAPPELLDQHEQNFVAKIREHGWFDTQVGGESDRPGFSYTTGFWLKFKVPELIVFALRPKVAHDTFWYIYRELEAGKRFAVGERTEDIFVNLKSVLLLVSPEQYPSYLGWNRWFYGNDNFQCLQLLYPDAGGYFPWSPGVLEHERAAQPDLTEGNWSGLRERYN
jgi:hypothetical protein